MVVASELRDGMVIKVGQEIFKVIEAVYHAGGGKMGGVAHAKLRNIRSGNLKELRFRSDERLEEVQLERHEMQYLYTDADTATFMNPQTFEQVSLPLEAIGSAEKFLKPEMRMPVQFYEGQPVSIIFPQTVELRVETTTQPVHQQQDNTYKYATLENGLEVMVPQFIKPGEIVRIEVATQKYLERVRTDPKKF